VIAFSSIKDDEHSGEYKPELPVAK